MSIRTRMLLLSVLAFTYGLWCVYAAKRDLVLAPNEGTAHAVVKLHGHSKNASILDDLRCDFFFDVGNQPYRGHGVCPKEMLPSNKWSAVDYIGGRDLYVTVYYDPSNPMTNSMRDFATQSKWEYKKAELSITAGIVLLLVWPFSNWISGNNGAAGDVLGSEATLIAQESGTQQFKRLDGEAEI